MKGTNWHAVQMRERAEEHIAQLHREAQAHRDAKLARSPRGWTSTAVLAAVADFGRRVARTLAARPKRARTRS